MTMPIAGGPYRIEELEAMFPWISWREPQVVSVIGEVEEHFACRVCIANRGLKGRDIPALPASADEVRAHIALEHLEAFRGVGRADT